MSIKHVLYLHGFASSPSSNKANIFCDKFRQIGINCQIPDLNEPDFEHLLLTAILAKVAETIRALPDGDVALIGSSLGGLTALHFIDTYPEEAQRVKKLILMAPAFESSLRNDESMDDATRAMMVEWQSTGTRPFFNYAYNKEVPVHYALVEDLAKYDSYTVAYDIPTIIFHGKNDISVPYEQSVRFDQQHNHVKLYVRDSDHQLLDQTDFMWERIQAFVIESHS